ncbi:MAG: hypothetical protein ACI3YI_12500 [Bacteroidaceae bacterium]
MKAILTNKLSGESVDVHSTTEHPDSSYGQPVWVDNEWQAYCQCNLPNPLYEIEIIEGDEKA